jgi:hypothetical protein
MMDVKLIMNTPFFVNLVTKFVTILNAVTNCGFNTIDSAGKSPASVHGSPSGESALADFYVLSKGFIPMRYEAQKAQFMPAHLNMSVGRA